MNLSLLTSDFWSVLVGVTLLGERVGSWCVAALAMIAVVALGTVWGIVRVLANHHGHHYSFTIIHVLDRYAFAFVSVVVGLLLYHWSDGPGCPDRLTEPLVEVTVI